MERKILLVSLALSILIHLSLAFFLYKADVKKEKKEESKKPITISFVEAPENKSAVSKRKIPKKTKLTTPSKSAKPVSKPNKQKTKKKPQKKKKVKEVEKSKKIIKEPQKKEKKQPKKLAYKKEETKTQKNPPKKEEEKEKEIKQVKKEKKEEQPPKEEKKLPLKEENIKIPQIADKSKKEEKNEKPNINVPLSPKINDAKEKQPPQQLNLTHLKGKDEIFQPKSEETPKKEVLATATGDMRKYLFYVRDTLQENLHYPLMAKRLQIEGTAIVRFVINEDGSVDEDTIKIVKSSGSKILDRQAVITVKNSIPFDPPPKKEKVVIEIPVVFEIIRY